MLSLQEQMKSLKAIWFLCMGMLCGATAMAQEDTVKSVYRAQKIGFEIIDGDTVSVYQYGDYIIKGNQTQVEKEALNRLKRNVLVALPYAKLAAFRLQVMEDNLNLLSSKKEKKKYVKECEKAIKKQFMGDLQNLTRDQGKLLLKLIHRETGKTTWDILSDYRGGLEAMVWQAVAQTYNADTHDTYDPVLDYQIEIIIRSYEMEQVTSPQ